MTNSTALGITDTVARIGGAALPSHGRTGAAALTLPGRIGGIQAKAHAAAQSFEATFLNSMFQFMFTDTNGDGPLSGSGATGIWRGFLTQEYSKSIVKAGGIGLADQVYRSLMTHQEVRAQ
jgi:Rod binding domain-containing protein